MSVQLRVTRNWSTSQPFPWSRSRTVNIRPQLKETGPSRNQKTNLAGENSAKPKAAYLFNPYQPLGQHLTNQTIWQLFEQNPYLEYKVENDQVYVVSDGADLSFIVPKERNIPEQYPLKKGDRLASAFRLLGWAFLGLAPAGLGTLIFAPLAVWRALPVYLHQPSTQADRVRSVIVLGIAGGLLGIAFILNYLLLLHFQ